MLISHTLIRPLLHQAMLGLRRESKLGGHQLHCISTDRDQESVQEFQCVTNSCGLLRNLPSLSSRNDMLLGWESERPALG